MNITSIYLVLTLGFEDDFRSLVEVAQSNVGACNSFEISPMAYSEVLRGSRKTTSVFEKFLMCDLWADEVSWIELILVRDTSCQRYRLRNFE